MRSLIVSEFISLDGVIQAPGGAEEDTDGGFAHGGWTMPYWHDAIGAAFGELLADFDTILLGRRTYVTHAQAFEPDPAGDPFAGAAKYVVSKTLEKSLWKDTTIIRGDVIAEVRKLKARPGKSILSDGSSQLIHALLEADLVDQLHLLLYPVVLGGGKRLFPTGPSSKWQLEAATPIPSGVVRLQYRRAR